ncbi:non-homologous end-joining DNA ligase [Microbispora sp. ATCC PTA-5024]|uniref:non-homologous end-joining DNA ligase n=1 Tax=Microbispora sp. ATCC PTA-5024 TaxID=316330 RepID=UPI0003DD6AF3|nr:non-homologous end-joining DNA ligase [Microbispora sp. ATCC PTA-5024]ETK37723.1 DNA polymerase [Microbispora sp. ATCC PTA-5024]
MVHLPPYRPMMAQLGTLPDDDAAWSHEMKWDGVRALAYVENRALRLVSRNGHDITTAYPELYAMAGATGGRDVVLDGEIVAFDEAGRPSFGALQPRMHQRQPARIAQLVASVPVTFLAFDVLHVGAAPAIAMPYVERRGLLEGILTPGPRWQVPVWFAHAGRTALESSRRLGLEGIVAKRLDSPYRPGRRSPDWTKVKNVATQEVVIGGWKPGAGRRSGMVGSLLMGVHDEAGRLMYVGHVGTGFTEAALRDLLERLAPLERPAAPFADVVPREHARGARWVEPRLVGEVQYAEWTDDGRLRHPSWRGLRWDKPPQEVNLAEARRAREGRDGTAEAG